MSAHIRVLLCLVSLVCAGAAAARAQTPLPPSPSPSASPSAAEPFVIELSRTAVRFEQDGTGERAIELRVKINTEAGVQRWGELAFAYVAATEKLAVMRFEVRKADGSIVKGGDANIQDAAVQPGAGDRVFQDLRQTHLTVPSLRPGDTLAVGMRWTVHTSVAPGHFWTSYSFARDITILDEELDLDIPAASTATLRVQPDAPREAADLKGTVGNGRRVYRWKTSHVVDPSKKVDEDEEDDGEKVPVADVRLSTFRSWDEVGRWYAGLARPAAVADATVRAKAEDLVKGLQTDDDRIRAVYAYVSGDIRYVSLSFGVGRYAPHSAAEVLANQYGDCKDKHTLLAAMLGAIGIQAWPALANVGRKIAEDVPSPLEFNHLITAVPRGNRPEEWIWLDTTPGVAPYRLLTVGLRDKQVLVTRWETPATSSGQATSILVRTPASLPFAFEHRIEIDGPVDSLGVLRGHVKQTMRGDDEILSRAAFRMTGANQWPDLAKAMAAGLGLDGTVSGGKVSELEATSKPLVFEYELRSSGVLDLEKSTVTLPLPALNLGATDEESWKKRSRLDLGPPLVIVLSTSLDLPPAYHVLLPAGIALTRGPFDYSSTYTTEGTKLIAVRTLRIRSSEILAAQSAEYLSFVRAVRADEGQKVALVSDASAAPTIPDGATASELYTAGNAAYKGRRYESAIVFWKRAADVDPKHDSAFDAMGLAYEQLGRRKEAVEAFEHQIAINPYHKQAHKDLARVLEAIDERERARDEYTKHVEINPLDGPAIGELGRLLLSSKRYDEAAATLEKAVAIVKDDAWLYAYLGRSYALLGDAAKARGATDQAVRVSETPAIWTYASWTLAASGHDLARATELAGKTLVRGAESLAGGTAAAVTDAQLDLVERIVWSWAALGTAALQKGDLQTAERHLSTAFGIAGALDMADRLGQVYEKLGRSADATGTYLSALAGTRVPPQWIKDRLRRLLGPDADLDPLIAGARRLLASEHGARFEARAAEDAKAEFLVIVEPNGATADVKFLRGDESMKQYEPQLRAARYPITFDQESIPRLPMEARVGCIGKSRQCFSVLQPPGRRARN